MDKQYIMSGSFWEYIGVTPI